jgi:hypothetical protein
MVLTKRLYLSLSAADTTNPALTEKEMKASTKTITIKCFACNTRHEVTSENCITERDDNNTPQWQAVFPCGERHELSTSQEHSLGLVGAITAEQMSL